MVKKVSKKTPRSVNKKPVYKWDVVSAEKEYLSDTTMSYKQISEKYKINVRTVENYAKANNWVERRFELGKKGIEKFEVNQTELIAEANERHLKLYKNMQSAGNNALVKVINDSKDRDGKVTKMPVIKDMQGAAGVLKMGIEGERTVLGLPTMIQGFGNDKGEKDIATWTDLMLAVMEAEKDGTI